MVDRRDMSGLLRPRRIAPVVLVLALTIRGSAQVVPTNGAPAGLIVGQVVDSTGAPISEAIVRLTMPRPPAELPSPPKGRVMADSEGRFFFADLPAGEYYLSAGKEGYNGSAYGQQRVSGGQIVSLGEGERRADVKLMLWKYAVIGGTVVDEAGEPVIGVAIRALVRRVVAGRVQFGDVPWQVPATTTDDRGMFRLSQLKPATYVVVAPSTSTTVPAPMLLEYDYALRTQLFWAGVSEVPLLGEPRSQQMGDVALMTLNTVLVPPPVSATGRTQVYRTTYYPAAVTAGGAAPIAVDAGEERTDVTITLRPVPAVRVSGRLVTPDGSVPSPTTIRLVGDAATDVVTPSLPSGPADVGFETATGLSDAAGRFTLLGVPPGEYVLQHGDQFLGSAAQQGRPAFWFSQHVTVGTSDLSDLTVQLQPPLRVEGRIEFSGANGPPAAPQTFSAGITFETPFGGPGQFAVSARNAAPFSTVAAGGQYIVHAGLIGAAPELARWFVKSVTLDGQDITDRAFDLETDVTSLVVTFTDRPSRVSGMVKDSRGAVAQDAIVLAFPVDPQRWSGYGSEPRTIRGAPTSDAGDYKFDHLPAGDYYLIAIDAAAADDWTDPKRLNVLARQATRLTVVEAESKGLELTLTAIR
jgi:Carboxypeptidase regulatory-like domain